MFTIKEASGKIHEGVTVQGAGNEAGRQTLEREIRRANRGQALLIYEPSPGHVRAFVRTAQEDTNERDIDLRGASIL